MFFKRFAIPPDTSEARRPGVLRRVSSETLSRCDPRPKPSADFDAMNTSKPRPNPNALPGLRHPKPAGLQCAGTFFPGAGSRQGRPPAAKFSTFGVHACTFMAAIILDACGHSPVSVYGVVAGHSALPAQYPGRRTRRLQFALTRQAADHPPAFLEYHSSVISTSLETKASRRGKTSPTLLVIVPSENLKVRTPRSPAKAISYSTGTPDFVRMVVNAPKIEKPFV